MSTKTQTLRRQAFVDDQLSVDEVVAFQEELSAEDKKEVERERAYEKALAERLRFLRGVHPDGFSVEQDAPA